MMIVRVRRASDPFNPADPFEEAETDVPSSTTPKNDESGKGKSRSFDDSGPSKITNYLCATKPEWSADAQCWVTMLKYETKNGDTGMKPHRLGKDKKERPGDVVIHGQKLPKC